MTGAHNPPLLRVSVERAGDTAVVRLDGELDCASAPEVEAALARVYDDCAPLQRVVIDADRLSFIDVAGLTPLLVARHKLPDDVTMQLRNARRQVVRVIRLLDLADTLGLDV